jgi:ubiquinone/menaquinone biosynthesis C-methylase UbiE
MLTTMARQLGRPDGPLGRLVGRLLNRANGTAVTAAVEATGVTRGDVVADVGFGGQLGLRLLLDRVAPTGIVHGIEISQTMLAQARQRFGRELSDGRLELHDATMDRLPLPTGSLDAVVSTNTIYFVAELHVGLTEIARVLRPGGRLVLGIGDPTGMAKRPFTKYGFTLRPISDVVQRVSEAGLSVVDHRRVGTDPEAFHLVIAERSTTGSPTTR